MAATTLKCAEFCAFTSNRSLFSGLAFVWKRTVVRVTDYFYRACGLHHLLTAPYTPPPPLPAILLEGAAATGPQTGVCRRSWTPWCWCRGTVPASVSEAYRASCGDAGGGGGCGLSFQFN